MAPPVEFGAKRKAGTAGCAGYNMDFLIHGERVAQDGTAWEWASKISDSKFNHGPHGPHGQKNEISRQ
ncbi:hypothetical protein FACS189485_17790 [Spirochaetia bacterium]|nr:hypothetical protein FACS189485_17790 [Spirochaetia bacterium]